MPQPQETQSLAVHSVLRALGRRYWVVAVCALLAAGSALGFSLLQVPEYSATSQLLFRDPALDEKLFGTPFFSPPVDPAREAATNIELVALPGIYERTAEALDTSLGTVRDRVDVEAGGDSDLIEVTASATRPEFAATLANSFARQYIRFRRTADRRKIGEAQELVETEQSRLDQGTTRARELQERADDLEVLGALQTGNAELVQRAAPPVGAASPRPVRNTVLGGVLGLLIGIAVAVLLDRIDRRLRDPNEIETLLKRPVLATVPYSRGLAKGGPTEGKLSPAQREAFQMLRANLRYFNIDQAVKSVLITSAAPSEGKSTVAWRLAQAAADAGVRTMLIEADLRRPALARSDSLDQWVGLTNVLAGTATLAEATQSFATKRGDGYPPNRDMDVIVAGPLPPNPADLIESQQMAELIRAAEVDHDFVVIDTPPTGVVSDAVPLIKQVSGVIVVVRLGQTRREAVSHLGRQLSNLDAPTLGTVVNAVGSGIRAYGYGYYAPYGYASNGSAARRAEAHS